MNKTQIQSFDIIIVGGGMVGMTLAIALAKQTNFSVTILETSPHLPAWIETQYYHRVSAISLASVRIFKALNIWPLICNKRVSPFSHIHVWDAETEAQVDFDSRDIAEPVLGYIIENAAMQTALYESISHLPQINYIANTKLTQMQQSDTHIELIADHGQVYSASLAIAADGANSWLREKAGISITKKAYDQKAIVTTVTTTLPHQQLAQQVFLPTGPLAFLPLQNQYTSSIVWSLPTVEADTMLALADDDFKLQLSAAFSHKLGDVIHIEKRFAFPLQMQQAKSYIKDRIVLVGDAAHTVHPLAGQGVNMGLLDAACLADVVREACHKQLRRYERWRKADNAIMMMSMDAIKNIFSSDKQAIRSLRSHGLSMTNQVAMLRNMFMRHAVGNRGDLPHLANQLYCAHFKE